MIHYTTFPSPLGNITLASQGGYLIAAWFPTQSGIDLTDAVLCDEDPVLQQACEWLTRYFAGEILECNIPMKPEGTAFQERVWANLREIPYGETTTYGGLASRFGRMSAQAVGQAVGRNPISILIPCHRVLGANRKLTGYTGGLDIKTFLLDLEHIKY